MKKRCFTAPLCLLLAVLILFSAGCTVSKNDTTTSDSPTASPTESIGLSETQSAATPTLTPTSSPNKTKVTGVRLGKEKMTLTIGEATRLNVYVSPLSAENKEVKWKSSNNDIVSVIDGYLVPQKIGTAVISVVTIDGGFTASCTVTVSEKIVSVESITFDKAALDLIIGEETSLSVSILPTNATDKSVSYAIENDKIVSFNDGKVKALKEGVTSIIATSANGIKAVSIITVHKKNIPATGISLNRTELTVKLGEAAMLAATVQPTDTTDRTVVWSIDNPDIATVENGRVSALKVGTAIVTVNTADGKYQATCKITVEAEKNDPIDDIDLSAAVADPDDSGYNGGLRLKSSGEIVLSPSLDVLRTLLDTNGKNYSDYNAYLRFIFLPSNDDEVRYSYHSIVLQPVKSKGEWVDFYLAGPDIDSEFCPTAGASYEIELVLVEKSAPTKGVISATYHFTANNNCKNSEYYSPTPIGGQIVRNEGEYYIRYKAGTGGIVAGNLKQLVGNGMVSTAVTAVAKDGYIFIGWSDGVLTATRVGDTATEDLTVTAYFSVSDTIGNIPVLNIYTDDGDPITQKVYETGKIVVSGASAAEYNITASLKIRCRGNSSLNTGASQNQYDSKNSYRIKFDEKVQFLGIGDSKNKDWVLNSNKFDISQLRNFLVWELANKMGTLPYVTECEWVQLYINGSYRGMYMVTELVETATDRVEVDDSVASEEVGFLIELDFRGNYDDDPYFYIDGYGPDPKRDLHGAVEFCIKSKVQNDAQLAFIENYIQQCHNAIKSGNKENISKYIDLDSLVDMYIIEELSKDCDAGRASFYIQRDVGGKLYFTAPWDFDFGFGTYGQATYTSGLVSSTESCCIWFGMLIEHSWFRNMLLERMEELDTAFKDTLQAVRTKGAELKLDADKSNLFWETYGTNYHQYVSSQVSSKLYSYEEHIDFLVNWAEERWSNLYEIIKNY